MLNKQEIRKNREKMRLNMQGCLVTVKNQLKMSLENSNTSKLQDNGEIKMRKRKTSQDINILKNNLLLREVYISTCFQDIFQLGVKIGQGTESRVYECIEKQTGKKFAAKIISTSDQDRINSLKQQYRILRSLNHHNILKVNYLFINQKNSTVHLVCQLYNSPDLFQYLYTKGRLKQGEAANIASSILNGLVYLHQKGTTHRDLKPQNIIYDSETQMIKLIDFSLTKMKRPNELRLQMLTNTGTLHYKAPEMFKGLYDQLIDVWALGVIVYQMITSKLPFSNEYVEDTVQLILNAQPEFPPQLFTPICQDFIKRCLAKNPLHRMTARQALRSPWILNYCGTSSSLHSQSMKRSISLYVLEEQKMEQKVKYYDEMQSGEQQTDLRKDIGIRCINS